MVNGEPFFGPQHLPDPKEEAVAWVDLMGTSEMMKWSPPTTITNIGKLHMAVMQSNAVEELELYPMMDGIYLIGEVTEENNPVADVLFNLYEVFSNIIVKRYEDEEKSDVKFSPLIRAGISEGKVYHGMDVEETEFAKLPFVNSLVMGKPIVEAHISEHIAPPFGIHLHRSVDDEAAGEDIEWWRQEWGERVHEALDECLKYHSHNPDIAYTISDREDHLSQAKGYFPDFTTEEPIDTD